MPASPLPHSPYGHPKRIIGGSAAVAGQGFSDIKLPVGFATADGAVLYTVPEGMYLCVLRTFWEVTTAWTGGTSSAIGASSSNSAYGTKGDLQGGASGDLLAALTVGNRPGTIGAKFGSNGLVVLGPGDTVKFDRVASAFTAGAGYLHLLAATIGIGAA
jgi:hypothetical protein